MTKFWPPSQRTLPRQRMQLRSLPPLDTGLNRGNFNYQRSAFLQLPLYPPTPMRRTPLLINLLSPLHRTLHHGRGGVRAPHPLHATREEVYQEGGGVLANAIRLVIKDSGLLPLLVVESFSIRTARVLGSRPFFQLQPG